MGTVVNIINGFSAIPPLLAVTASFFDIFGRQRKLEPSQGPLNMRRINATRGLRALLFALALIMTASKQADASTLKL